MSTQASHSRRSLSVAIVARDDEVVLAETLTNARPWADEMVVLDVESSDRTAEIASSLGARVARTAWRSDYSALRNQLLEQLTGQWVLWLEPGERVAEATWPELRRLVDSAPDLDTVYGLLVEIPLLKPSGSVEQAALLRLMPNRPELRFVGRVAETLRPSVEQMGMKTALAPGRILRPARCHDIRWKSARAWHILDLAAMETHHGTTPPLRVLLAMGDAASDLEDRALARQAYSEVVRTAVRGSLEMLQGYYGMLANFGGDSGDAERQLTVCLEALEVFPLDAQLLCAMGTYLQAQNRFDLATRAYRVALEHGRIELETWHLADLDQVTASCLAVTLQLTGDDSAAQSVLEQVLARRPDSKRIRRQLIDLHIKHGDIQQAVAAADTVGLAPLKREPLVIAIRGACLASSRQWTPALALLQSAYVAGCEDPICLRWLSVVLLSTGQTTAAAPVLRRWASVEPDNAEVLAYLETIEKKDSSEVSSGGETASGVWYRVDPPAATTDVDSPQTMIVSQFMSSET